MKAYHVADRRGHGQARRDGEPVPPARGAARRDRRSSPRRLALNRYPDPSAPALKARLRRCSACPSARTCCSATAPTSSSRCVALTLARPGAVMLAPEPSFVMYRMIARHPRMRYVGVPLEPDFSARPRPHARRASREHRPALVFLAYPNNPTGNLFPPRRSSAIIARRARTGGGRRGLSRVRAAQLHAALGRLPQPAGDAHGVQARAGRHAPRLCARRRRRGSTSSTRCACRTTSACSPRRVAERVLEHVDVLEAQAAVIARGARRPVDAAGATCPA